jgi:hypothetical protein
MKQIILFVMALLFASPTLANDIYITQSGDTLDLDIVQDGQDNEFGDSTTDATLDGDAMTFNITQTGDYNQIDAIIKGNTYTGTWTFTGDDNTVDLTCDSTSGVNCEDVTLNIGVSGDDNNFKIYIGESADTEDLVANFTITGNSSGVYADIDGTDANITVVSNNSSTGVTAGAGNRTHLTYDVQADSEGNLIAIDSTGNGDVAGHTVDLTITGGGSDYIIIQSGIYDNKVDATFSGDSQNVQITQSD